MALMGRMGGQRSVTTIITSGMDSLDAAIHLVFPDARHQKCVTHFKRNIMRYVKADHKEE